MPETNAAGHPDHEEADTPRVLADVRALTGDATAPSGALWKLDRTGRQLDANLVHLPPGEGVDTHAEPDLDVLLLVAGGDGTLVTTDGPQHLTEGALVWLPRTSRRSLTAGEHGLFYLTVHRRRPGMHIRHRPEGN